MSNPEMTLTKTRLREGVWEGLLCCEGEDAPKLTVTHLEVALENVTVEAAGEGKWQLCVPVPATALSDGVQTFLIQDEATGETLDSFAISAGSPLSEDLRCEVALLRAELDMLKRAFRRHCVETEA